MSDPIDFIKAKEQLESSQKVRCAHCGRWIAMDLTRCTYCGVHFEGAAMQFAHPSERAEAIHDLTQRRKLAVILFAVATAATVAISALAASR
jgi:hypothetical protein